MKITKKLMLTFCTVILLSAVIGVILVRSNSADEQDQSSNFIAEESSTTENTDENIPSSIEESVNSDSSISQENSFNYFIEVTVSVMNENNKDGKVMIANWVLVGKNGDFVTTTDPQLLMDTDYRVNDYLSSITTAPGKEISLKLAYPMAWIKSEKLVKKNATYKLSVTKYPIRKYIYLEA